MRLELKQEYKKTRPKKKQTLKRFEKAETIFLLLVLPQLVLQMGHEDIPHADLITVKFRSRPEPKNLKWKRN